jgi:hypothetical protein
MLKLKIYRNSGLRDVSSVFDLLKVQKFLDEMLRNLFFFRLHSLFSYRTRQRSLNVKLIVVCLEHYSFRPAQGLFGGYRSVLQPMLLSEVSLISIMGRIGSTSVFR